MINPNQICSNNIFQDKDNNLWMLQYIDTGTPDLKFCNLFAFSYLDGLDTSKSYFTTENNARTFKQCYWPDIERGIRNVSIIDVMFTSDLFEAANQHNIKFFSY
mgnify:FL=1